MKRIFLAIGLILRSFSTAHAHSQSPITTYVQASGTVCVAKATAISNRVVTFTVEEVVKGHPPAALTLHIAMVPVGIDLNSEWLLASTGANKDSVGWAMEGDYGWVNAPIRRVDGKIHLVGYYGYVDPSLASNVSKGLTLEQLQELAKKPLPKY